MPTPFRVKETMSAGTMLYSGFDFQSVDVPLLMGYSDEQDPLSTLIALDWWSHSPKLTLIHT